MKGKIPKILSVGLALVFVLSLSLVMAVPAVAAVPDVWVDDDWESQDDVNLFDDTLSWDMDAFDTIVEGVGAVAEGGTVNVAEGTYEEQVTIGVPGVTLLSEEFANTGSVTKDTTLINGGGGDKTAVTITADGVTLQGFSIYNYLYGVDVENASATIDHCIIYDTDVENTGPPRGILAHLEQSSDAFVTITNNEIYDNVLGGGWTDTGGRGINVYSDAAGDSCGVLIDNNEIYGNDQRGISVFHLPATITNNYVHDTGVAFGNRMYNVAINIAWNKGDVLIQKNNIEGVTPGNFVYAAGIYLFADTASGFGYDSGYYGSITIDDNSIDTGSTASGINLNCPAEETFDISVTNNTISGSTGELGGIYAWSMEDYIAYVSSIEANTITGNSRGIQLWRCEVGSLHYNNIYDNTDCGVYKSETPDVDVTNNWWGDAGGPGADLDGDSVFGDAVSEYVVYSPWLPGTWQTYYDPDTGLEIDTDEDGFSDLEEYWLGTDPEDGTDFPGAPVEEMDTTYVPASGTSTAETTNAAVEVTAGTEGASVSLSEYEGTPKEESVFGAVGSYIDVHTETPGNLEEVIIRVSYDDSDMTEAEESSLRMSYWDSEVGDWRQCSDQSVDIDNEVIEATITALTTPNLSYLAGGPFGSGAMSVELDSEWYKTGYTVEVTVEDVDANVDPVEYYEITVEAVSDSDPVGEEEIVLTETGLNTAVFTGSFNLVGTPPPGTGNVYVEPGDTITVTYLEVGYTATVDDTAPTIGTLTPDDGAIVYDTTPDISAVFTEEGSDIDEESIVMTVNGGAVTTAYDPVNKIVSYTSPELAAGSTVEVTVDVDDNVGNSAETASWSFTIASGLNVSVDPTTWIAGNAGDLIVTITGVDQLGPNGAGGNALDWAKVEVSAPVGQSLATGEYYFDGSNPQNLGDADTGGPTTVTFSGLLPNDASSDITVTVIGELDDGTAVGPVTKTIPVSGFVVTDITPSADQIIDTPSDISVTVTKAGEPVSTGLVTITAALAGGFEKDVAGDEELEPFQTITIDGLTGEIRYDGDNPETCSVIGGFYQVTGIKFAKLGGVGIEVAAENVTRAQFSPAFSVLGEEVYTFSFEPTMLTAGVDGTGLKITITEDGDAVTDVTAITVGGVGKNFTRTDNVYTVTDALLYTEEKPLTVMAKNVDGTKWGDDTLEVALPAVSYVITDTNEVERDLMLTGETYTVSVTVTDALGEALDGSLWIGTYDETATPSFVEVETTLIAEGTGEFDINRAEAETLVWKIGSGAVITEAVLVLEPAIAVEDLYFDLNPTEATVGVNTTYTVTDNYTDPAADRDIKIVTPSIETVTKTTGPAGTPLAGKFMYNAAEVGDYYVSVKIDNGWQAPITVTVSVPPVTLESIAAPPESVSLNVGETEQLTITATYSDASTDDVTADSTYESSDPLVATVSTTGGLITGVAVGDATVTVTVTYLTETTTVEVTVSGAGVFDPMVYDADGDGVISKAEAITALTDYLVAGSITKANVVEVLILYLGI